MVNTAALVAVAASVLFSTPVHAGLYLQNSPVLQVDAKSYDRLIAKSNHTSIVEFYAPWCGHCQNLKPAYEKAAKNLKGLAKVAAVDCDDDENKPLCGSLGIKGFPTLKIVRPSKKPGRPTVEDYQGARSAKAIVDTVVEKIPNHVKRVTDKTLDEWLKEGNETAKAILFSDKGTTSALLRALAIDFLGSIEVAQIRDKEKKAVETFGIDKFPKLVLLPGGEKEGIVYDSEMKKEPMSAFLSQIAPPNPDPAPVEPKASKKSSVKKDAKKSSKDSSSFSKASASHKSADSESAKTSQMSETLESATQPTESPDPQIVSEDSQKPIVLPEAAPMIPAMETEEALKKDCFQPRSHTCILALLPAKASEEVALPEDATTALQSLSEVHHKHDVRGTHLFPFYSVPASNEMAGKLRQALGLKGEDAIELVAVNAKRNWWKYYTDEDLGLVGVEGWIDAIRMGEGKKERLPDGLVEDLPQEPMKAETEEKAEESAEPEVENPLKIVVEEISEEHDEL